MMEWMRGRKYLESESGKFEYTFEREEHGKD